MTRARCYLGLLALAIGAAGCAAPEQPAPSPRRLPPSIEGESPSAATAPTDCRVAARLLLSRSGARGGIRLASSVPAAAIDNDLALPTGGPPTEPICRLSIESLRVLPPGTRQEQGSAERSSSYVATVRRRANPRHRALERAIDAAEGRTPAAATRVLATGEPTVDLIGSAAELLLTGIDRLVRHGRARDLRAELNDTPAEVEEPLLRAYRYRATTIEATRKAEATVSLADSQGVEVTRAVLRSTERRQFQIVDGRRSDDPRPLAGDELADWQALGAWEMAGPVLRVSSLLEQLLDPAAQPAAAPSTEAAPLILPPAGAVLRVRSRAGEAIAIRVAPKTAVAFDTALGETALVRTADAAGNIDGFALIVARDPRHHLAAIEPPTAGPTALLGEPAVGPVAALAVTEHGLEGRSGRLVRDGGGDLRWSSGDLAGLGLGSPVLAASGAVVGLLADVDPAGAALLPASRLAAVAAKGGPPAPAIPPAAGAHQAE